ncbi:MAG: heme ABC exporter ATP-binding protein CcmA [bacterium]|nr:heme ABC exporter ATP-binding protein CcmA [bacterium]
MKPLLEVHQLTKAFDGRPVLKGISFQVGAGEIVGLLGPNGAGKTTTLQMLVGLTLPTSGSIHVDGLDLAHHRETILSRINFSSTYVSLPYALTVRENLDVFARLYGVVNRRAAIEGVLEALDLGSLRDRLTRELSSGQQTRLHLAKALINDPKLLILDEPTASLDPDVADRIRSLLTERSRRTGMSILMTSHNLAEVERMVDRLIFLQAGEIVADGRTADILKAHEVPDLETFYLRLARSGHGG